KAAASPVAAPQATSKASARRATSGRSGDSASCSVGAAVSTSGAGSCWSRRRSTVQSPAAEAVSASAVSTPPAAAAFTPPSRATPAANDPATLLIAQRTLRRAKDRPCSGRGTRSAIHRVQELFATTPRIADAPAQQSSTIYFTNGENRRKGRLE